MRSFSLRDWQKSSVARLLKLKDGVDGVGDEGGEGGNWSEEWKVLLLDTHTRSIVSPLLTVPQLRSLGVTLTLSLESPRDAIPDVSAVYFVRPTPASLRTILDDCASARYRDSYLHFSSPLPRPHLEALARGCVEAGVAARIRKVTDAWQAFIALEPHLFSLAHRPSSSYAAYASPAAANEEAQGAFLEECTQGLLGTLATAGIVPLIVYQPGGPSAALARALEGAIREHMAAPGQGVYGPVLGSGGAASSPPPPAIVGAFGRRATPMGVGQGSRPVLILLDRGCDLATPLAHASTYRALMDDTLGPIGLNRVTVPADLDEGGSSTSAAAAAAAAASASSSAAGWLGGVLGGSSASKAKAPGKVVALDVEADPFWITHAGDEFPVASEAAAAEVARLAEREGVIRSAAGGGEGGDAAALQHQQAIAAAGLPPEGGESELGSAIDSLPALLRHKAILKTHSTLLTAIMASVRKRSLPSFSEVQPPSRSPMEKPAVLAILAEGGKGSVDDKARLACVHLLTCALSTGDEGVGGSPAFTSTASALNAEYSECLAALRQGVYGEYGAAPPPSPSTTSAGQQQQQQQQPTLPPHIAAELSRATAALAYCKFIRVTPGAGGLGCHSYTAGGGLPASSSSTTASSAVGNLLGGMARAAMRGINAATRLMTTENTRPPIVRVTAAVCEGNPKLAGPLLTPLVEALEVRDPRMGGNASTQRWVNYLAAATATANAAAGGTAPPSGLAVAGAHFRNACVFVTGGGSYVEYGELERYAQEGKEGAGGGGGSTNPLGARTIVYGSTEMSSPSGFLAQLAELGAPHVRL